MEVLQDDTPIMYWEDLTDCVVSGDPTGYVYAKEVHLSAEGLQIK